MNELKDYQKEAIGHLAKWKVGALFMEAGTGKTRVACELINSVPDLDMVLWVGPLRTIKGNVGTVPMEVDKWGLNCKDVRFVGVESIGGSDRIFSEVLEEVEAHHNVFCVVDESLKIKNARAKRTNRLLMIGRKCAYRLILNGTPLSRNVMDVWAQFEFLSPKILNMSERRFMKTFCNYYTVDKGRFSVDVITGHANIEYLYSLIRNYIYECDLQLQVKQRYHNICYALEPLAKHDYADVKQKWLEMIEDENNDLTDQNYFLGMTSELQMSYCCCNNKVKACDEIVKKCDPEKVIIFTRFIKSAELCRKKWPKCKVLSYQKESYGLNLQQYNVTIYFDKIWDYALRVQSTHRTYRTGQSFDCEYYDLTGDVGLESMIDANIENKVSMSEYFKMTSKKQLEASL